MAMPGSVTESAHTAASKAKGTTTPSVNEMASGRMAALFAGTTVYRAYAPSCGRPVTKLMVCLCGMPTLACVILMPNKRYFL